MNNLTIEWVDPKSLKPYPNNAKIHTEEQVEAIARQLDMGWDQPIVIVEDDVILKGHGRHEGAMKRGYPLVPVHRRLGLTEEVKRAIRIADNKVAEAPWDSERLKIEFDFLSSAPELDLTFTGFKLSELDVILPPNESEVIVDPNKAWVGMPEFDQPDKSSFRHVVVHFRSHEDASEFFEKLQIEHTQKTKSIWFPALERKDTESKRYVE